MNPATRNPALSDSQDIVRVFLLIVIVLYNLRFINYRQRFCLTVLAGIMFVNNIRQYTSAGQQ